LAVELYTDKSSQNRAVLFKLVLFAVLMAVVPIGTYFATLKYFTKGESLVLSTISFFRRQQTSRGLDH